ncbi:MAG: glycosyltransferase family 4 protein [Acidobacteriota bacterium]|nr:MAG: glycosyltransferase family 4 protein [Acidobacteriota bacterium]
MRVGIDGRAIVAGPAGVATYVRNLLSWLPELDPLCQPFPGNNFLWNQLRVPWAELSRSWDLYHGPGYTAPLLRLCPMVLAVHDISYLAHPEWYPYRLDWFRKAYYLASLRRADRILVPSEFTRQEVERILPGLTRRVRKIPLAVSSEFHSDSRAAEKVRSDFELPDAFLLHVGDIHRRRNLPLLQQVARSVGLSLVLVGRVLDAGIRIQENVRILSGVSIDQLRGLYSAAAVFVYASMYEGFGFPPLEAMACGLPVVAVKRGAVPEVCGEAALWAEPAAAAFEEAVREGLEDRPTWAARGFDQANSFSWERTALATRAAYRELI